MKKIKRRHIMVCILVMLYVFVLGKSFYIISHCEEIRQAHEKEVFEECLEYINYWEVTNDGLNIYDQYGNKYEWR